MAPEDISTLKHGLLYGTCQRITGLSIFAILATINCWFGEQQEITLGSSPMYPQLLPDAFFSCRPWLCSRREAFRVTE